MRFCSSMFLQIIRQRDFLFCGFGLVTLSICIKLWLYVFISSCQISSLTRSLLCLFWWLGVHANNLHIQSSVFGFLWIAWGLACFCFVEKGIIFNANCLNFSFIVKIYRMRFWFWYLSGIIVVLRLILCCIEWSCNWIDNVMISKKKNKIVVCKFISNWVSWFVRRWFFY